MVNTKRFLRTVTVIGVAVGILVVLEIVALVWIADLLGWWTLALILASGVAGFAVLGFAGRRALADLQQAVRTLSATVAVDPAGRGLLFLGGVLLLVPGFLTDSVALLCIIPPTRNLIRSGIAWWSRRWWDRSGFIMPGPTTIPGEVVEEDPSSADDGPLVIEGTVIEENERQEP